MWIRKCEVMTQLEQGKGKHTEEVKPGDKWRDVRNKRKQQGRANSGYVPILYQSPLFIASLNPG